MPVAMPPGAVILAATVPAAFGLAVGWFLWRLRGQEDSSILAGAGAVMLLVIVFILREGVSVLNAIGRCRDAGIPCRFDPEPAMRYAIVAGIGMVQILAVFVVGWIVTGRRQRQHAA